VDLALVVLTYQVGTNARVHCHLSETHMVQMVVDHHILSVFMTLIARNTRNATPSLKNVTMYVLNPESVAKVQFVEQLIIEPNANVPLVQEEIHLLNVQSAIRVPQCEIVQET